MTKRTIVSIKWITGPDGNNINKITKSLIILDIPRTVGIMLLNLFSINPLLKRFHKDFSEETALTSFIRNIKT